MTCPDLEAFGVFASNLFCVMGVIILVVNVTNP